jgi:parallel beta-helix repeat protein
MKKSLMFLALVGIVLISTSPLWADGEMCVIVSGRGVGTKITSLPYTITSPGFYYLTGNLSSSGSGIDVQSPHVTIDLMGFQLTGAGDVGITVGENDVEVRNGCLNGWGYGVSVAGGAHYDRFFNLRMQDCSSGIYGSPGSEGPIQVQGCSFIGENSLYAIYLPSWRLGCIVTGNTIYSFSEGIYCNGTINGNTITNCGTAIHCIFVSTVRGNTVSGIGTGIHIDSSDYCLVTGNTVNGAGTPFIGGTNTVSINNAGF